MGNRKSRIQVPKQHVNVAEHQFRTELPKQPVYITENVLICGFVRRDNKALPNIDNAIQVITSYSKMFHIWDAKSSHLKFKDNSKTIIKNTCTDNTWQTAITSALYISGIHSFEFKILNSVQTITNSVHLNSWKIIIGIVPFDFCLQDRAYVGWKKSWGYIGGTGGKINKSFGYTGGTAGYSSGYKAGDIIKCTVNYYNKTIEFFKNGKSNGIAFNDLDCKVRPAVSVIGYGTIIQILSDTVAVTEFFQGEFMDNASFMEQHFDSNDEIRSFAHSKKHIEHMVFGYIRRHSDQLSNIPGIIHEIIKFAQVHFQWDSNLMSKNMMILKDCSNTIITDTGSSNIWQGAVSNLLLNSGNPSFEFLILKDAGTTNSWKIIVGVVPVTFDPQRTAWIGSQDSWGYVAGTGGKCYGVGKFIPYAEKYREGDRIKCRLHFENKTIEFFKNDISMGIAFRNLNCAVKPAVSITGKGTKIQISL